MHFQYIGTAAAEAIPAVFCQCDACKRAREAGGKSIRGRSGAIIDGRLMIDFPPDIYAQSVRLSLNLPDVQAVIFTHSHCDHLAPMEICMRSEICYCHLKNENQGKPLLLYGNEQVEQVLSDGFKREFGRWADFCAFQVVKPFETLNIIDYEVTPLPARHAPGETPYIYLVEKDGIAILYAHDTGDLFEENYAYLKSRNLHLNFCSFDCTNFWEREGHGHMGLPNVADAIARLKENGNLDATTRLVVNHFSHNRADTHEKMLETAAPYGVEVSFDGMEIEL